MLSLSLDCHVQKSKLSSCPTRLSRRRNPFLQLASKGSDLTDEDIDAFTSSSQARPFSYGFFPAEKVVSCCSRLECSFEWFWLTALKSRFLYVLYHPQSLPCLVSVSLCFLVGTTGQWFPRFSRNGSVDHGWKLIQQWKVEDTGWKDLRWSQVEWIVGSSWCATWWLIPRLVSGL